MHNPLSIVVVGAGNIGGYWLDHFATTLPPWAHVRGVYSSRKFLELAPEAEVSQWRNELAAQATYTPAQIAARITTQIQHLKQTSAAASQRAEVVVLDLTANHAVSQAYTSWIQAGAHIISANKHAGSSPQDKYLALRSALKQANKLWFYNTTVGAALPIQKAIQERRACGDSIRAIVGLCSGSLSWILNQYQNAQKPFSYWLQIAAEEGLTEPDPRQDLNGQDVAKKLLILAREAGWRLSLNDIQVQSLVPPALVDVPLETFWQSLAQVDAHIDKLLAPFSKGQVNYLSEVAVTTDTTQGLTATAGLANVASDSPFANLKAGDNAFQIRSAHYENAPLTIQGPGAGRQVTAAGVHSDILELIQHLES